MVSFTNHHLWWGDEVVRSLRCWERDIMKLPRFIGASGCNDICVTCLAKVCQKKNENETKTKDTKGVFWITTSVLTVWTWCAQAVVTSNGNRCGPSSACTSKHAARGSPCAANMKVTQVHPDATESTSTFTSSQINAAYKGPSIFKNLWKSFLPIPMMIFIWTNKNFVPFSRRSAHQPAMWRNQHIKWIRLLPQNNY